MEHSFVDFHCHLDLFPDMQRAVTETEAARIYTLAVTTTPKAWARNHQLTRETRHVRAALGLHPQLVSDRHGELPLWEEYLPHTRYVGEIGLDAGPQFYKSFELQKRIFIHILQTCARAGNKILSIHSVRSAKTVLDLVEEHFPADRGKIVLHWFTGSKSEARRAVDLGCYFSINNAMLQSHRGQALTQTLPAERILTETDAPFTQVNGRPAIPADVVETVGTLSTLRRIDATTMAETIERNLRSLLGSTDD
jgi:TatD DNase family protein